MATARIVQDSRSVACDWRIAAHKGAVECIRVKRLDQSLAASSSNVRIYTAGRDGSINAWNAKGRLVLSLKGHASAVTALQVSKGLV
jgi:WD40 repeat protein